MQTIVSWGVSAAVLIVLAIILGHRTMARSAIGILVDSRGRMSLTHLQLTLWTILILSLISGVFFGRLFAQVASPLNFGIPNEVLALMGIVIGSSVAATVTKSAKNADPQASKRIPVPGPGERPRLPQIFMVEEGALADKVIDITKFQNFAFTMVLLVAYTALALSEILKTPDTPLSALPGLSSQFLTLLGISHAGYIAGKLPSQTGFPDKPETVSSRDARSRQVASAAPTPTPAPTP